MPGGGGGTLLRDPWKSLQQQCGFADDGQTGRRQRRGTNGEADGSRGAVVAVASFWWGKVVSWRRESTNSEDRKTARRTAAGEGLHPGGKHHSLGRDTVAKGATNPGSRTGLPVLDMYVSKFTFARNLQWPLLLFFTSALCIPTCRVLY